MCDKIVVYQPIIQELNESEILADLNSVAEELGLITEVYEQSKIYIYYAVFARVFGKMSRIFTQYIQSIDIDTCSDEALLNQLIKPFIIKRDAQVAKVILKFRRRDVNQEQFDLFIPMNFEVSTEGDNPIVFRTAESRLMWKDTYEVDIVAYSVDYGTANNVSAGTLTYFRDNSLYAYIAVTNANSAYGGRDEETAFDARDRISLYRYGRDGSKPHISNMVIDAGYGYNQFAVHEYYDGYGSILLALDTDNDDFYYDSITNIELNKIAGIKYHYCQVERIYLNMSIDINITGDRNYDSYDIVNIEQSIDEAVNFYFSQNIFVAQKLSIKRLEAYIFQYLVNKQYEIYEINIDIGEDTSLDIDPYTYEIIPQPYQKLYPNKIYTDITYDKV